MRADVYIFTSGNAKSRQAARVLIESGNVLLDGKKVGKPSDNVNELQEHKVEIINKARFVSRGGEKLDFALEKFKIDVTSLKCIDIGASTGGFTDCLLQRGAKLVYAVDSGHSQLDPSLESDKRIISIEKYNAKYLSTKDFPTSFDIAVMDVSFISQTLIHRGIFDVLCDGGILVSLIKPQFECGKNALNSKGVIRNSKHHVQAITKVIDNALICGFSCMDVVKSPIQGGSGNVEFLACFIKSDNPHNHVNEEKIKQLTHTK